MLAVCVFLNFRVGLSLVVGFFSLASCWLLAFLVGCVFECWCFRVVLLLFICVWCWLVCPPAKKNHGGKVWLVLAWRNARERLNKFNTTWLGGKSVAWRNARGNLPRRKGNR